MMKLFTKAESHYMTYEIAHIAAVNMVAALCCEYCRITKENF